MRAGALRHRITIESRTETQNATGEPIYTWATYAAVFAEIKTQTGNEGMAGDQVATEEIVLVKMRYYPNITTAMRVNYEGRYFDINYIDNVIEHDRTLVLHCREA
jgi:SPP1 family predicted phage head-tail adaptor